jgi:histidinol-phosphatase (PHP family)
MQADYHMHTSFSLDSEADPESMIQGAIEKGLKRICITDHEDKDYIYEGEEFTFPVEQYFQRLQELKARYQDQIEVCIGVEIGLQPYLGEYYHTYVKEHPFDFVIGSVHLIGGKDPYEPEFFEGRSDAEAYRETLVETLQDIQMIPDFDVLGHLDYVVRYGKHQDEEYSYHAFADEIDAILRYLIEHGKGLELNTAGLKYGLPFAHPHTDVLKRYRELGGEIITIGSDAHKPEHIAYDFSKVKGILVDCGFGFYTEFSDRKPVFRQLT